MRQVFYQGTRDAAATQPPCVKLFSYGFEEENAII